MPNDETVYIVDDDELARESVRALCESMNVSARTFESAEEFLAAYEPDSGGCVVTDLRMVGMSGLGLQQRLHEVGAGLPVIVITAHATTELTVRAIQDGAITLLEKPCDEQALWESICAGLARDRDERKSRAAQQEFDERLAELTAEEREVLDLMVDGKPNKTIAMEQEVSERTVETRRQKVFRKMGAESLAQLVRFVVQGRISSDEPDAET